MAIAGRSCGPGGQLSDLVDRRPGPGPLLTRALATDTGIGHRRLCWNTSAHSRRGNQRPHEHVLRPDVGGLARHKHTNAADCMKRDCLACSLQLGWHHAAIRIGAYKHLWVVNRICAAMVAFAVYGLGMATQKSARRNLTSHGCSGCASQAVPSSQHSCALSRGGRVDSELNDTDTS